MPGMRAEIPAFTGFSRDHFSFFRELAHHNSKEWFDENRKRYESLVAAFRALLARLEPSVLRLNPHFETAGKTNRNFSRINRDIRFRPDKSPYHTNYYLYFYDRRRDRHSDGRLYVGASGEGLTVGFSIYAERKTGALVRVFRPRLETDRERLERWLASHLARRHYDCYWYRREKKQWVKVEGVPGSEADWKRLEGWVVRKVFRPSHPGLATASLAHEIQLTFDHLFPLYAFTSLESPDWEKHLPGERGH